MGLYSGPDVLEVRISSCTCKPLRHVQIGHFFAKVRYLWEVVFNYVRIIRILDGKILMVRLSFVESVETAIS